MQKDKNSKRATEDNVPLRDWVNHAATPLEIAKELADNERVSKKIQKQASVPFFKEAPPYDEK